MNALPAKKKKNTDRYGRERNERPRQDTPMRRFSEAIDKELLQSFLDQSGNERYQTLVLLLQDPAHMHDTFSTLCHKANITLHEMQELYTNGMRQRALVHM